MRDGEPAELNITAETAQNCASSRLTWFHDLQLLLAMAHRKLLDHCPWYVQLHFRIDYRHVSQA